MDFKHLAAGIISSFLFFFRRVLYLIVSPYKAMREISEDNDMLQVVYIFICIGIYFYFANNLRTYPHAPWVLLFMTIFHYLITVTYFSLFTILSTKQHRVKIAPFLLLFSYALIPTLIWFITNSVLFALIPPPRTPSFLGKGFSIVYLSFSIGMLLWKIIVTYLAIRFATGLRFFRIVYSMLLYLIAVIPYSMLLYSLKFFRIPFL